MIISTAPTSEPIITNVASTPTRFKIKASAKAFKVLSGFYSDPILAIPRELGANAWDSHVKAGNTQRMFEVHAPNHLEPWFSIRDYGTGLSVDDIENIYTTYFESTKTLDNDSDGCMGLGSKTPFNCTDNFNVTSWFEGKKHVYTCFVDEMGSPNIMHIVSEKSNGHSGLEVKFGVEVGKIDMWVDRITRAYEPFRFRPIITGATIEYPERTYMYHGQGWGFRNQVGYGSSGANAFMGNYSYPVDSHAIRSALQTIIPDYAERNALQRALSNGQFDFFFNIGDLEVAPNKEQLQYEDDNSTTLAIIDIIQVAVKELKELAAQNLPTAGTRWEGMALYGKVNSYNSEYHKLREIIGSLPIVVNGEEILASNMSAHAVHNAVRPNIQSIGEFQLYKIDKIAGKMKRTSTYYSEDDTPSIFFFTNGGNVKRARLRSYLDTKYTSSNFPHCYIVTDTTPNAGLFREHVKYFGWDTKSIIEIETLPNPPKIVRTSRTAKTNEIWYTTTTQPTNGRAFHPSWQTKPETFSGTETYYYIDFLWYDPALDGANISRPFAADLIRIFAEKKLVDGVSIIYGINKKNQNLLKVGTWCNVCKMAIKYIKANKAEFEQILYELEYNRTLQEYHEMRQRLVDNDITKHITNPDTKAVFKEFIKLSKLDTVDRSKSFSCDFFDHLKISPKKHKPDPLDVDAFKTLIDTKYMGIFDLIPRYSTGSGKTIGNLINFIDANS